MTPYRYRSAIIAFAGVLFCFLLLGALMITVQQNNQLTEMIRSKNAAVLDLMSDAFYEALLKSDYITIRTFIDRWGEAHEELVRIRAVAPNGFVVGDFPGPRREAPARSP